jgi:hypothetical protein
MFPCSTAILTGKIFLWGRAHQGSSDIMPVRSMIAADKDLAGRAAGEEIYPTAILFLEEGLDKKAQFITIVG